MTKPARNQPCPCGSGKKFKQCCGRLGNGGPPATSRDAISQSGKDMGEAQQRCGAGQFAEAALMCGEVLRSSPNDPNALRVLSQIRDAAMSAVEGFRRNGVSGSIATLRHVRREIVSMLRSLPMELLLSWQFAFLVDAHTAVKESGLIALGRDSDDEAQFQNIKSDLHSAGSEALYSSALLAGMLLGQNFEIPAPRDLELIPEWMRDRYCAFLLEMPGVFIQLGDADRYAAYLSNVVTLFHRKCFGNHGIHDGVSARKFINLFVGQANFVQAYFNSLNNRGMYEQRGDLISAALIVEGAFPLTAFTFRTKNNDKLRLGIFSQTFAPHTETYFTLSHFDFIDRARFDVTLYAMKATGTALEQHCIAQADRFKVLAGGSPAADAELIRADQLDILLIGTNMTAVTNSATSFGALRMAPIQIASVSSPVTTGLRHVDIVLSAQWNEPDRDSGDHYCERLWLMPGSVNYYAFQYDNELATLGFSRSGLGIAEKAIVFFSGANFFKIIPELSQIWATILAAVPDSVLLLMPFNPNWGKSYEEGAFKERVVRQLRDAEVDPRRLLIVKPLPTRADVHKVLAIADVYLDAHPFAGACSLLDPIFLGIPPVIRSGRVGRSNHGAAMAQMIELDELICESDEAYVSLAVELGTNASKRQQMGSVLKALHKSTPLRYFDTAAFSKKVGDALNAIHGQYVDRYRALEKAGPDALCRILQDLADSVVGRNFELNTLTDIGLVKALVKPFFHGVGPGRPHHMIDVGACHGAMAEPFLSTGWTADLFEPDPEARAILERNVAKYASRCRISASAVSNEARRETAFHRSSTHGLSGLENSPFGSTVEILMVPCVRLADFYVRSNVPEVDFLKIDAEGYDFDVLDSHDFKARRPRIILVEYGTHFPRQSLENINEAIARMAGEGYGAISFNYQDDGNFKNGQWKYRLTDVFVDRPVPDLGRIMFGNILFYRVGDTDFLLTLHSLLDSCRPRAEVWRQA